LHNPEFSLHTGHYPTSALVPGITDTTGNMGKMGMYCREHGRRHAYCTDHNFNRNAQLAFDRKLIFHINIFDIHHIMLIPDENPYVPFNGTQGIKKT